MSLEEEVKELRKIVEELAEEVKKIKSKIESRERVEIEVEEIKAPSRNKIVQEIFKVLEKGLADKPDVGIVFVGGFEKRKGKIVDSFFSGVDLESVYKVSASRIVRILSSLANENRVKILLSLLKGPKTASELSKETGLEGGPLYHHLKELMLAGYIESPERGKYVLTPRGCMTIRAIAALALIPGIVPSQTEELESIS